MIKSPLPGGMHRFTEHAA